MSLTTKPIASEGQHWYAQDGTPCYEVPCKSRPGEMRPTTLRDARSLNLVPSTTTIIAAANRPGLRRYFDRMVWEATMTTPKVDGESDDEHFARCMSWADEHSRLARDKGTAIHGSIEAWLKREFYPAEHGPHVDAFAQAIASVGIEREMVMPERSFACPMGYGGRIDGSGDWFLFDVKTKDSLARKPLAYDEHCTQLSAYREGIQRPAARCFNIFLGTANADWHVHEWSEDDMSRCWRKFRHLLAYWMEDNDYFPNRTQQPS